jgi:hypothetical protein
MTPRLGTDGNRIVYPVRGIVQGARAVGHHPQRTQRIRRDTVAAAALRGGLSCVAVTHFESPRQCLYSPPWPRWRTMSVRFAVATWPHVHRGTVDSSSADTASRLCLFGPLAAALVGAASMLGDPSSLRAATRERAPRLKWATYTSTRVISGAVNGVRRTGDFEPVDTTFGGLVVASLVWRVDGRDRRGLLSATYSARSEGDQCVMLLRLSCRCS